MKNWRNIRVEPKKSLTFISGRTLACIISISYDRTQPGEDERALQCYRTLLEAMAREGYYSYRLGIQSMDAAVRHDEYGGLLASLKQTLDPNGILSPGRYVPDTSRVRSHDPHSSAHAAALK